MAIPSGVTVVVDDARVRVKGPKGELSLHVLTGTTVTVERGTVTAEPIVRNPAFGTMRALIQNMVTGVTTGFSKTLEIVGTGYRAQMDGKKLVLQLGFSHPIRFVRPRNHDQAREPDASRSAAPTRRWSDRSRRTSAASVRPSRTRARASSTKASSSAARPARPRGIVLMSGQHDRTSAGSVATGFASA